MDVEVGGSVAPSKERALLSQASQSLPLSTISLLLMTLNKLFNIFDPYFHHMQIEDNILSFQTV